MKNRYPGACMLCKAQVLPGQGTIHRLGARWNITHHACPRRDHEEKARSLTRRTMAVLDDMGSDTSQLAVAVYDLGRLAASGWLDTETWRTRVMASYAARVVDRLELEELLDAHLPMCA